MKISNGVKPKQKITSFLRWSQKYTRTDMIYLAKGGFWLTLGRISALLLSLATMTAFSRWFSKESFGTYQYVISTVGILAIFALPAMEGALTRTIARGNEGMLRSCAKTKFKWASIGSILCFALAFWYILHHNSTLGYAFLLAGAFLPFTRMFNLFSAFWQGKKRFDVEARYSIVINFFEAVSIILAILLTDNIIIVLAVYFISRSLFRALFYLRTLKKTDNSKQDKDTIPFAKHLTLMQTLGKLAAQIDKIIIWQFLGPVSVAVYAFAQMPVERAGGLIPMDTLALPKLSQQNIKKIKKELFQKFLKFLLFTIPFAAIFALLVPYVFRILFPEYLNSVPYAQALSLTFILIPFALIQTALVANVKTKQLYIIQTIGPILKIALCLSLVPIYGIWGIITAILGARTITGMLTLYLFKKLT